VPGRPPPPVAELPLNTALNILTILLRAILFPLKIVSPETCKFLGQEFGVDGDRDCGNFWYEKFDQILAIKRKIHPGISLGA